MTDHPRSWLERLTDFITGEPQDRDDLIEILHACHARGLFGADALGIIEGALSIADLPVREAMIPRSQMVMVNASQHPREFLPLIIESAHSRFPVIDDDNEDTVIGILLAKDLLAACFEGRLDTFDLRQNLRKPMYVPQSRRLDALLRDFRQRRSHMAVVIDEFGGLAGLVTIEDVLEQIVGEIEDEHDVEEDPDTNIKDIGNSRWLVRSRVPVEEFNGFFGTTYADDDFDTIGGMIIARLGHLPARDEVLVLGEFQFKVVNADNRGIQLLQVTRSA